MKQNIQLTKVFNKLSEAKIGILFILPAFLFYTVFLMWPIWKTIYNSFFEWDGIGKMTYIGLGNFIRLLQDPVFLTALKNNLIYIIFAATIQVAFALFVAVMLEEGLPGSKFFRGMYFVPTVISYVVIGVLFSLILSPDMGLFNPFLKSLGLNKLATIAWLGERIPAKISVIFIQIWKNFGFSMFLFVAGLKSINQQLYEAARIDGANKWQLFTNITLPSLHNVTTVVILLAIIHILKIFDLVYVMTHGGPNHATEVLATWMYYQGFRFNNMGYGSSIATVLLIITAIISVFQLKISSKKN